MDEKHTRGEMHGCIVCGALYQLYVVSDAKGKFVDFKVMSPGGKRVPHPSRPLVACEKHTEEEIRAAVRRAYGSEEDDDD
ncbi:MAG: hypothetical protein DPW18_17135 [Chloroflexi bacterium]|nr:hypothetical protein [Chloroflexota bacterium]MDL1941700.1 hypothetical protein [Chloroflexi bacterium CFX2]